MILNMFKKLQKVTYGLLLGYLFLPTLDLLAAVGDPPVTSTTLKNPLKITSIEDLLIAILNILIIIAIPVIVFFIIYSGFLYVTARGNAQQIEQATRSLTYAVIGGVLIIGAVAIAEIVKNLVTSF